MTLFEASSSQAAIAGLGQSTSTTALTAMRLSRFLHTIVLLDLIVVAGATLAATALQTPRLPEVSNAVSIALVDGAIAVVLLVALRLAGSYDPRNLGYGAEEYGLILKAGVRTFAVVALTDYFTPLQIGHTFLASCFAVATCGLVAGRWVGRQALHRARAQGHGWSHRVLVVGDVQHVMELIGQLRREAWTGYQVVGVCIPHALAAPQPQRLGDVPVVGSFRTIIEAATAAQADTIAVTASAELTASRLRRLGWQLEGSGIDLLVAPALTDVAGPRIRIRPVAGLPLIHVEPPDLNGRARIIKGLTDWVISALGLLLASPLLLVIAAAIKFDSRGPVLFRQRRVGRDGEEFDVFKFRTMYTDAEERLAELRHLNEGDGLLFKMRNDPRVTRVGRFLRRYSLDELPQVLNVFTGSMSLVGPRPPLPSEVALYDSDVARRLLIKPGITGLWQVSGRSDLSWEDAIRLDLYYVENWSVTTDLLIIWKTLGAVVRARGAY